MGQFQFRKRAEGDRDDPSSYNVMPLPQDAASKGYILKNFRYYETVVFHDNGFYHTIPVDATAPNRGGSITHNAHAVFYDQRLQFTDPSAHEGEVVDVENGVWLSMHKLQRQDGPYPPGPAPDVDHGERQPDDIRIAKQNAVPHGNSVLALGGYKIYDGKGIIEGRPIILDAPPPYPKPCVGDASCAHPDMAEISVLPYSGASARQILYPDFTLQPNAPLHAAMDHIKAANFMHWKVTTFPQVHAAGGVSNIQFRERRANVSDYHAKFWLLSNLHSRRTGEPRFNNRAYTQTMFMDMYIRISGAEHRLTFPHVTYHVLKRH